MRWREDVPLDPDVAAELEAIDATLAGEPVAPRYAEPAELALLLASIRAVPEPDFARALDARVQRHFVPAAARVGPGSARRSRTWRWLAGPACGLAVAVGVVIAVVLPGGGSGPEARSVAASAPAHSSASSGSIASSSAAVSPPPVGNATLGPDVRAAAGAAAQALTPLRLPANGRKTVSSSQLDLTVAPARMQSVAQEVFDVIGRENGIVERSSVTVEAGPGGYSQFQLEVPSGSLPVTMAELSQLPGASVASRTDASSDVTDQYGRDTRRLADARALRTSLLQQLTAAVTQTQIDSLTAQIHDAEASIASDEATLRGLQHQVGYSQISVTINGVPPVASAPRARVGFTLGRAANDAGRVLTVAAGVALIALAALLPVALLAALGAWIAHALRRRARERALDAA